MSVSSLSPILTHPNRPKTRVIQDIAGCNSPTFPQLLSSYKSKLLEHMLVACTQLYSPFCPSVRPSVCRSNFTFWAAAPKGTKSCRTQGEFLRPSVRPSPPTPFSGICLLWSANPSKMAQIQAKWQNPSKMAKFWLENLNFGQNSIILAPKI